MPELDRLSHPEPLRAIGAGLTGKDCPQVMIAIDRDVPPEVDIHDMVIILVRAADEIIRPFEPLIGNDTEPLYSEGAD